MTRPVSRQKSPPDPAAKSAKKEDGVNVTPAVVASSNSSDQNHPLWLKAVDTAGDLVLLDKNISTSK